LLDIQTIEQPKKKFNVAKKMWGKGVDYREIAKKLTVINEKPISFTGVRSIFLRTMEKIAYDCIESCRPEIVGSKKRELSKELAASLAFQNAVGEYLHEAWYHKQ
jgi:hypothetical protein